MNKAEKAASIEALKDKFNNNEFFYITDSSELTVEKVNKLRSLCFEKGVEMKVAKNTLIIKALESEPEDKGYKALFDSLKGPTTLLFSDTANLPARVMEEFRKENDKPVLKAAYIDSDVYVGDDQIKALASLKSKDELVGEIITLLQSPIQNVTSALKSGSTTLAGLIKTLQEREA